MSQILLVRHGQASFGSDDYDVLSGLGQKQSRALGEALAARGLHPDVVVRGSMRRHRQTAELAMEGGGWSGEVVEDAGWDEFDHQQMLALHPHSYDADESLTREQFQTWFEQATSRWTSGAHDEEYHESFGAFASRVDGAMRRTVERLARNRTALVFTSGGPVAWVAASLLGGGAPVWSQLNPVTVNSSVTKVVVGRRGRTLVSFNEHTHLEAAGSGFITYR